MADETGISWTDHTHNEWWGCSAPAGAGCDHCYAAQLDKRTGGKHFGIGTAPRLTKDPNRNKPYRWNREAEAAGVRAKVFCGSMMDFFDKNAPYGAREPLWVKIKETTNLDWQLLTKRPSNIPAMLPDDWGVGYENVWLGVTVENKRSGLRRLDQLRDIPAKVRFLSVEPLLEDLGEIDLTGINWVICGSESGRNRRPMKTEWIESIFHQCRESGVMFFMKQMEFGGKVTGDIDLFPQQMQIREMPK